VQNRTSHSETLRCLLLALSRKPASEKRRARSLVQDLLDAETPSSLLEELISVLTRDEWCVAEKELREAEEQNVQVYSLFDREYPGALREIIEPPLVIFVRGSLPQAKGLAIVGSRKCTPYGEGFASAIAQRASELEIPVVSGFARGIDACAHRGAMRGRAPGLGILGSGVLRIYPAEHERLAEEFLSSGGAILSEYGLHMAPRDYFFPERNRLVSAMSKAVVVVEAERRSGALITARLAAEQGREVFALPGSILSPLSEGTNWLLKCGSAPITSIEDLSTLWPEILSRGSAEGRKNERAPSSEKLPPEAERLLSLLDFQVCKPFDSIVEQMDRPAGDIAQLLSMLELEGQITRLPGAVFLKNQTVDIT